MKVLPLFLLLLAVFCLTACGSSDVPEEAQQTDTPAEAVEDVDFLPETDDVTVENPYEEVPEANPFEETNPFAETNPFE